MFFFHLEKAHTQNLQRAENITKLPAGVRHNITPTWEPSEPLVLLFVLLHLTRKSLISSGKTAPRRSFYGELGG